MTWQRWPKNFARMKPGHVNSGFAGSSASLRVETVRRLAHLSRGALPRAGPVIGVMRLFPGNDRCADPTAASPDLHDVFGDIELFGEFFRDQKRNLLTKRSLVDTFTSPKLVKPVNGVSEKLKISESGCLGSRSTGTPPSSAAALREQYAGTLG